MEWRTFRQAYVFPVCVFRQLFLTVLLLQSYKKAGLQQDPCAFSRKLLKLI